MTTYWLNGEREPPPNSQGSTSNTLPGSVPSLTAIGHGLGSSIIEGNPIGSSFMDNTTIGSTVSSPMLPRHQSNNKATANHNSITASTPLLQGDSG